MRRAPMRRAAEQVRRDRITLEMIAERANLMLAVWKAARGKRTRPAVTRYLDDLDRNLNALADEILTERAPRGRFHTFTIHDPKRRTITAACFADRVLHHAILNLAESRFERMLVPSTYACRPGKGVHAAVAAVQRHLQCCDDRPWLVQVDVDGYFPSIDHRILTELLARRFKDDRFLALLGRIIDRGASSGRACGLPIGSLTSQHFANAYLDGADRFLLSLPGVRGHVRYMDDIVWWCRDRRVASESLRELVGHLRETRALRLKTSARIVRSECGLQYCGFRVRRGVVLASSRKLSRYRRACRRIEEAMKRGRVAEQDIQRASDGALATLAGCETSGFRARLHHSESFGEEDS